MSRALTRIAHEIVERNRGLDELALVGIRTRRDEQSPSDWIRVMIDSFHDRRSAYSFAVNPAGVKQDAYWFNDGQSDEGWDAVWDVAVSRDASGWRAEFRIPFSQLRFNDAEVQRWGVNVDYWTPSTNEDVFWIPVPKKETGWSSWMGQLAGISGIHPTRRLELLPYMASEATMNATPISPVNTTGMWYFMLPNMIRARMPMA